MSLEKSKSTAFSILIPTWNNLNYVRLCYESLQKNSSAHHQIILHINDGSDGTLEWAKQQGLAFTHSQTNIGICLGLNQAALLACHDYLVYLNDDMYVLPDWDSALSELIARLPDQRFFLSSTMIEPRDTGNPCVIVAPDYGDSFTNFDEAKLLKDYKRFVKEDWAGATWPPNIIHRELWHLVGGYSIEFSPGMYSDPDFSMKLWKVGVRYFQGVAASRVFHFQCQTTQKVVKNDGRLQFKRKWGLSGSRFMRNYLHRGERFAGPLREPGESFFLKRWRG